jgi:hypothetical protein
MSAIGILLLAAPLALLQPASPDCDHLRSGSRISTSGTHIDSDDDGRSPIISFTKSDGSSCRSATIVGRLRYSENEDDIIEMPFGGYASFRERTAGDDRELTFSRGGDGGIVKLYRRNGTVTPYDADAKRWLAALMPAVLMEAAINVAPRVARWRAQGGVDNVLAQIGTMSSSGAKRAHYEALMSAGQLSDADYDKLIRHAGRNLPSSGDLRAVLEKAAPTRGGARSGSALEEAVAHVASSGDRTAVLAAYGRTTDREMLLSVMRMARTIPSSGDKAGLLEQLAPRYLKTTDHELHTSFFQASETIPSSGDLSGVLKAAIPYAVNSQEQALLLIDVARHVPSSGDRSSVLIALVGSGAVKPGVVREAFMEAAAGVPSSGDRSRVMQAAVRY